MTNDDFTRAARAEAERRWPRVARRNKTADEWLDEGMASGFVLGAQWSAARAAREALNGLYEDASQEYRIGLQGDDQERMDAAEAVLRATYAWMDNYPEGDDQ